MQARNYVKFPSTHFFKHLCYILKQFQNLIVLSGVIDYDEGERRKLDAIDIYQLSGKGEIPSAKIHDGAILTLTKQVEWGDHVRPVCLPYNPNIEKLNKNLEIAKLMMSDGRIEAIRSIVNNRRIKFINPLRKVLNENTQSFVLDELN